MSPFTTHGFAARAMGKALEPFGYAAPKLEECDVRVSITHCGVCHTDIQAIDDYYGLTDFPFVPGHEIVGTVAEAGPAVTDLHVGDRVGIGWQGRCCDQCTWCQSGEYHLCRKIDRMGAWTPYGGFSSSILVDSRFAYPLPQGIPSELAAPLLCAGLTSYAALRPFAGPTPKKLAIAGVGGLGHLAIQFAHALGFEVTAISSSPDKKEQALAYGADDFVLIDDRDAFLQRVFYFDLLLCTANSGINWDRLLNYITKNGTLLLAGFPDVAFNSTDLVAHQLALRGTFLGSPATMREMLDFAAVHNITPAVELTPMSQVNDALQRVRENKARYRIVLVNDLS